MSTIKDGGPAFPRPGANWTNVNNAPMGCDASLGMSLRDYMAIHASEEDVRRQCEVIRSAQVSSGGMGVLSDGWHVTARYMHADAMIAARAAIKEVEAAR